MNRKKATVWVLVVVLLAACGPTRESAEPELVDPAELAVFADAFFAKELEALHIPGLVFVFVQGGEVVYAQGYGSADLETATPMDVGSSLVRIGSISKLFVATAVMQLVEAGALDLDTDVNEYLTSFQLENPTSEPVTLAHLLTHTAGFEDPPYVSNTDPQLRVPLAAHLTAQMPPVSHRPGRDNLYSNYGYALAGLVVEEVSGLPFDRYVEEHILTPLGMTYSHYLLDLPLPETLAAGYFWEGSAQVPQPMDYDSDYPGGSLVSTAEEMSHFMLAHLGDGCYEGACILEPATLAQMHQVQAGSPFKGQSMTYGFIDGELGGHRLLGHGGAIRGFGADLGLLPEHDAGYFFAFNEECWQTSACDILPAFRQQLLARFFAG